MALAFLLYVAGMAVTIILAAMFGGRHEKMAAAALVGAAAISPLLSLHGYAGPEVGLVIVDSLLFAVLALIAFRSETFWPMWAAGFQLCALAVHAAAAASPQMLPAVYAETLGIWTFPVIASVAIGTWHEARLKHGHR